MSSTPKGIFWADSLYGVQTSLRAISAGTAQLPPIAPEETDHLIGRNTVECLNSGAVFGTAAMMEGWLTVWKPSWGSPSRWSPPAGWRGESSLLPPKGAL